MSNLQEFHHAEEAPDRSQTMVAIFIALVVAGFAFYVYEAVWNPTAHTVVSDSQLPAH